MIIYIFVGISKCLEGSVFFAEKSHFAQVASFDHKTAISAMNLKLCFKPCLYLS